MQEEWQLAERKLAAQRFSAELPEPHGPLALLRSRVSRSIVSKVQSAAMLRPQPATRKTERSFMRAHHGQGRVKPIEGASPPKPTRAERFQAKLAVLLPATSRRACEDLPRHAAYVLMDDDLRRRCREDALREAAGP